MEVSAECTIPEDLNSANLYLETDGSADFYVDSIDISVVSQNAEVLRTTYNWYGIPMKELCSI